MAAWTAEPPPMSSAIAMSMPMGTPTAMAGYLAMSFITEDLLHRAAEEPADGDREREGWQVASGLDRVDRLARDRQTGRELALAESQTLAQLPDLVLHAVKVP